MLENNSLEDILEKYNRLDKVVKQITSFTIQEIVDNTNNLILIKLYKSIVLYCLAEQGYSYPQLTMLLNKSYFFVRDYTQKGQHIILNKDYGYDIYLQIKERYNNEQTTKTTN